MPKLTEHAKELIKARGLWSVDPFDASGMSPDQSADEFCRLSEEFNKDIIPIPFSTVGDEQPVLGFDPDLLSWQRGAFDAVTQFNANVDYAFYNPADDLTSDEDHFLISLMVACAVRIAETHGIELASDQFTLGEPDIPKWVLPYLSHLGAFQYGNLRFRYNDPQNMVKRCLRAAFIASEGYGVSDALKSLVLPVCPTDRAFIATVSPFLRQFILAKFGISLSISTIQEGMFSGLCPSGLMRGGAAPYGENWEAVKMFFMAMKDGPMFKKYIILGPAFKVLHGFGVFLPNMDMYFERSVRDFVKDLEGSLPVVTTMSKDLADCGLIAEEYSGSQHQLVFSTQGKVGAKRHVFRAPEGYGLDNTIEGSLMSLAFGSHGRPSAGVKYSEMYHLPFGFPDLSYSDIVHTGKSKRFSFDQLTSSSSIGSPGMEF